MRSKMEQYYTQRVKNILRHLQEFEKSVGEEGLHEFRVELKKLRAIIKFLRSEYGKSEIKKIKTTVDHVFQEAGSLREQQLLLAWLGKNRLKRLQKEYATENPVTEISDGLKKVLNGVRKKLAVILEKNRQLVEKTGQATTDQYTAKLKHCIEGKLRHMPAEPEWHELRKLIKQWLYAVNWSSTDKSTSLSHLYTCSNQLQEAIGNWHDAINIHLSLLSMKSHLPKEPEIQKDHAAGLQKILAAIKHTAKEVEHLLMHSGFTGSNIQR